MVPIDDLLKLDTGWKTVSEDGRTWVLESPDPAPGDLSLLYEHILSGTGSWLDIGCDARLLVRVTCDPVIDLEQAYVYFESQVPEHSGDLSQTCLEISELIVGKATSQRVGSHIRLFIEKLLGAGITVSVIANVGKSELNKAASGANWAGTFWFRCRRFTDWLASLPLSDALGFLWSRPPKVVVVPDRESGSPRWLCSFEDIEKKAGELAALGAVVAQHMDDRRSELTAKTEGPIPTPDAFIGTDITWLSSSQMGHFVAVCVICTLASDHRIKGDQVELDFRLPTRGKSLRVHVSRSKVWDEAGQELEFTDDIIGEWMAFLDYYQQTCSEAPRHKRIWARALDMSFPNTAIELLTKLEVLVQMFKSLRDKLLDENMDKVLTAAERAQTVLGQLSSQIAKDVDSIGSEVEKLAVASITSGLIGISGAVFKSENIAVIGPIATALVFLWYFPLMFDRLEYLDSSIQRRADDLGKVLASFRRSAGDVFVETEYLQQLDPHRKAAANAILRIRGHLISILTLLHVVALTVMIYVLLKRGLDWVSLGGGAAVATYSLWLYFNQSLPTWLKRIIGVSAVLVLAALAMEATRIPLVADWISQAVQRCRLLWSLWTHE